MNKLNQASWLCFAMVLPFGQLWATFFIIPLVIIGIIRRFQASPAENTGHNTFLPIVMILFWFLTLVSIAYSSNQSEAITKTIQKSAFLIFPLLYFLNPSGSLEFSRFRKCYLISVCSSLALCYLSSFFDYLALGDHHYYYSSFVIWMHPSYYSLHLLLGTAILLEELTTIHLKSILAKETILLLAAFLLLQTGLVNTASKAGILADGLLLVYFSYLLVRNNPKSRFWFISMVFFGCLSIYFLAQTSLLEKTRFKSLLTYIKSNGEHADAGDSNRMRTQIYRASLQLAEENWLWGVGCGDVMDELKNYYESHQLQIPAQRTYNPHNQFIQTSISNGIIGLLLLGTLFAGGIWIGIQQQNPLLVAFLIICTFQFLFESMLERQNGIYFFCFIYLLLLPPNSSRTST